MAKNKTILSKNWSFGAKNWPKIAKKKIVKSLSSKPKLGQKWQKQSYFKPKLEFQSQKLAKNSQKINK